MVYFLVICYIFPVLVFCSKKNLATLSKYLLPYFRHLTSSVNLKTVEPNKIVWRLLSEKKHAAHLGSNPVTNQFSNIVPCRAVSTNYILGSINMWRNVIKTKDATFCEDKMFTAWQGTKTKSSKYIFNTLFTNSITHYYMQNMHCFFIYVHKYVHMTHWEKFEPTLSCRQARWPLFQVARTTTLC
jgi:hypothetical protein